MKALLIPEKVLHKKASGYLTPQVFVEPDPESDFGESIILDFAGAAGFGAKIQDAEARAAAKDKIAELRNALKAEGREASALAALLRKATYEKSRIDLDALDWEGGSNLEGVGWEAVTWDSLDKFLTAVEDRIVERGNFNHALAQLLRLDLKFTPSLNERLVDVIRNIQFLAKISNRIRLPREDRDMFITSAKTEISYLRGYFPLNARDAHFNRAFKASIEAVSEGKWQVAIRKLSAVGAGAHASVDVRTRINQARDRALRILKIFDDIAPYPLQRKNIEWDVRAEELISRPLDKQLEKVREITAFFSEKSPLPPEIERAVRLFQGDEWEDNYLLRKTRDELRELRRTDEENLKQDWGFDQNDISSLKDLYINIGELEDLNMFTNDKMPWFERELERTVRRIAVSIVERYATAQTPLANLSALDIVNRIVESVDSSYETFIFMNFPYSESVPFSTFSKIVTQ